MVMTCNKGYQLESKGSLTYTVIMWYLMNVLFSQLGHLLGHLFKLQFS